MARAISSLPVPVSPSKRTVESLGATVSTSSRTCFSAGLLPDDLLEAHLAADFFFEIELLLGELVFQFGNLLVCQRVFNCDGDLACSLAEETGTSFPWGMTVGFHRVDSSIKHPGKVTRRSGGRDPIRAIGCKSQFVGQTGNGLRGESVSAGRDIRANLPEEDFWPGITSGLSVSLGNRSPNDIDLGTRTMRPVVAWG